MARAHAGQPQNVVIRVGDEDVDQDHPLHVALADIYGVAMVANGAQVSSANPLPTAEQLAPAAEDNTNGVIAVTRKLTATNTYAPTLAASKGAATNGVAKASAGNLVAICATSTNAAVRWLHIFDSSAAPTASASSAVYVFMLPPNQTTIIPEGFFCGSGAYFPNGIAWGVSTSRTNWTAATASEHDIFFHVK